MVWPAEMRYTALMSGKKLTFEEYYRQLFARDDEFDEFLHNLSAEHKPILRFAPHNEARLKHMWHEASLPWQISPVWHYALMWPNTVPLGTTLPGNAEHLFFAMNPSSLYPVLTLDPQPGERILDACAAPGGKAVFIAEQMNYSGELVANDTSAARGQRLRQVLADYACTNTIVWKTKAETIFKRHPAHFDRILLDAPCSSERHVYLSPKHKAEWSISRIKRLKQQQIALINGLWLAVKPGGRLVYSTCAVNQAENEGVIEDFLHRHPEARLKQQQRIAPDATTFDPMFVATLTKPL